MVGKGARRAGIGIVDQLIYSLANFGLTILVARESTPSQFGAYSLIIATYLISLAVIRGLTSETFVIRYSATEGAAWTGGARAAAGACLSIGVVVGLGLIGAGIALHGTLGATAITLGILFPGLALQDFLRFAALARRRASVAIASDVLTMAVQFGLIGVLIAGDHASVPALVGAWGLAAQAGAVLGLVLLKLSPAIGRTRTWFRENGYLAVRYAADDLALQASQQGTSFVVASVTGLSDVGALRAAITVYGPPSILNLGVQTVVIPELVRVLARSSTSMRRAANLVGLGLGLLGAAWAAAALACPDRIGRALFGQSWTIAHPLLVYLGIAQIATGLRVGPIVGLRALQAADRTLQARLIVVLSSLAFSMVGAVLDGAHGVAVSLAIITPLQAGVWWWQMQLAINDHRRAISIRRRDEAWQKLIGTVDEPVSESTDVNWILTGDAERPQQRPARAGGARDPGRHAQPG